MIFLSNSYFSELAGPNMPAWIFRQLETTCPEKWKPVVRSLETILIGLLSRARKWLYCQARSRSAVRSRLYNTGISDKLLTPNQVRWSSFLKNGFTVSSCPEWRFPCARTEGSWTPEYSPAFSYIPKKNVPNPAVKENYLNSFLYTDFFASRGGSQKIANKKGAR